MNFFGRSHAGSVREENQDCFYCEELNASRALFVVCDGMGGGPAGSTASRLGCDSFVAQVHRILEEPETPLPVEMLREAASYANILVFDRSLADPACRGMATTLVAAYLTPDKITVANVGDSRCYVIRGKKLVQITRDHSYVESLVQKGEITREEAATHARRNEITRALGFEYRVKSDVFSFVPHPGDRLLLCSDGLIGALTENGAAELVRGAEDSVSGVNALVEQALLHGASDNITAVICIL